MVDLHSQYFSTIVAIGGDASRRRVSGAGALFGGIVYTILLALINFALQSEFPKLRMLIFLC